MYLLLGFNFNWVGGERTVQKQSQDTESPETSIPQSFVKWKKRKPRIYSFQGRLLPLISQSALLIKITTGHESSAEDGRIYAGQWGFS